MFAGGEAAVQCLLGCELHKQHSGFSSIQTDYWSSAKAVPGFDAIGFNFSLGVQWLGGKGSHHSAWAVRAGDVDAAAPGPATLALLGVGLAGLGFARRKQ